MFARFSSQTPLGIALRFTKDQIKTSDGTNATATIDAITATYSIEALMRHHDVVPGAGRVDYTQPRAVRVRCVSDSFIIARYIADIILN